MRTRKLAWLPWRKSSLVLSLGMVAATSASAQSSFNPPHLINSGKAYAWPVSLPPGTFGRVEPANLTPYSGTGAVVERSDGSSDWLVYAHAPNTTDFVYDLAIAPAGFGVLRGDIEAGVLDRLIVSTAGGLSAIAFDTSDNEFAFTTTAIPNTSAAAEAVWIACADFNADELQDIAAVCSNQLTVVVYRGTSSGEFVLDSSFTQGTTIEEIQPIQWREDAGYTGLEIAARSTVGVRVHSRTGTVLWGQLTGTAVHDMAVVGPYVARNPPYIVETLDKLALIVPVPGGDEYLSLHSYAEPGSSVNEAPSNLGAIGVVGADAGDYDNDGDWDLAISQQSSHRLLIFHNRIYDTGAGGYNQFPGETFDEATTARTVVRIGQVANAPMLSNVAHPLLQDITGDGLVDVLMGVHDEDAQDGGDFLLRIRGEDDANFEDSGECPDAFTAYYIHPAGQSGLYGSAVNSNELVVEFSVANIWVAYPGPTLPTDVHLEVTVRKQTVCNDYDITVSPELHAVYKLDPTISSHENFLRNLPSGATVRIGFSLDGVAHGDPNVVVPFYDKYYAEVRMVRYSNNTISSSFSPTIISCSGDTATNGVPDASCEPRLALANDPGVYDDCGQMLAQIVFSGGGDIDYIAEAFTQSSLPPFATGPLVYPQLVTTLAGP